MTPRCVRALPVLALVVALTACGDEAGPVAVSSPSPTVAAAAPSATGDVAGRKACDAARKLDPDAPDRGLVDVAAIYGPQSADLSIRITSALLGDYAKLVAAGSTGKSTTDAVARQIVSLVAACRRAGL